MTDRGRAAVIVGTAGHVDHGKSALVKALTGVNPDRLQEERDRGLTIELGFVRLDSAAGPEIGIVDVPGHEDFIRNMLAGATGVDVLLLAVAADEGPMPQTREHLAIASLLGIRHGLVALTKIDRVDEEWADLAARMVRDELDNAGLGADWPVVPVSAVTGAGLEELRTAIRTAASAVGTCTADDLFRLPVDRAFIVKGAGTVVTGSVWSGTVRRGDRVRLLPSGDSTRIRAIQVHGEERQQAGTGMRCALSLAGLALNQSARGETVVRDETWTGTHRFGARLRLLSEAGAALEHGDQVRLYHGTKETTARVLLGSQGSMAAGDRGWVVLACADPMVVRARDRFVIRSMSPVRTIGGGVVAYLDPGRRWREQAELWGEIIEGDPQRAEDTVIFLAGGSGVRRADIPLRTGLPAPSADRLPPTEVPGDLLFAPSAQSAARDRILDVIRRTHSDRPRAAGVSLESVRAAVTTRFASVLVEAELAKLEREGTIVREGPEVRLQEHSVQLTEREAESLDRVAAIIAKAGLAPPPPDRLSELTGIERSLVNDLLKILVASERLIQVNPEIYLSAEAEARLRAGAFKVLECESPVSPAVFGEEFGLSRRLLIPLLEYLDRLDITRRTATGRVRGDI